MTVWPTEGIPDRPDAWLSFGSHPGEPSRLPRVTIYLVDLTSRCCYRTLYDD